MSDENIFLISLLVFVVFSFFAVMIGVGVTNKNYEIDEKKVTITKTIENAINEKYKDIGIYRIQKNNCGYSDYIVKLKSDDTSNKYVDVHYETDDKIEVYEVKYECMK